MNSTTRSASIEDRIVLQDLLTAYCSAVDELSDVDALLHVFTEDAVVDLSAIHLPRLEGHAAIRAFFAAVFTTMTHHAHLWSNFRLDRLEGDEASVSAYVTGMGHSRDGNSVLVYVHYFLECVRTRGAWKIRGFFEKPLMPLPASLTEIHGRK